MEIKRNLMEMKKKKKKKHNLIQLMCEIDFHEFQLAKAIDQIAIICYFLTFHFTKYTRVWIHEEKN